MIPTITLCALPVVTIAVGAFVRIVFVETLEELCAIAFYDKQLLPKDLEPQFIKFSDMEIKPQRVFTREIENSVTKVTAAVAYVGTIMLSGFGTMLGCLLVASPFVTDGVVNSTMTLLYGFTLATVASDIYVRVTYASIVASVIAPGSYTGQKAHVVLTLQSVDGCKSFWKYLAKAIILPHCQTFEALSEVINHCC